MLKINNFKEENSENILIGKDHENIHDATSAENSDREDDSDKLVGLDMIRIGFAFNPDSPKRYQSWADLYQTFKKHRIHVSGKPSREKSYFYMKFNMNYILEDRSPLSRTTEYYGNVLSEVESIAQDYFDDKFDMKACLLSAVELHRTFPINRSSIDYYHVIKQMNLQKSRKHTFRENGDNSHSHYWKSAKETFVIYDKSDQMAYADKIGKNLYRRMDERLLRAEWRLLNHETILNKLKIQTPYDLLIQRSILDKVCSQAWATILPEFELTPTCKSADIATEIEHEFERQMKKGTNKVSQEAMENLFIRHLIHEGKIDQFLLAKKGRRETNLRLNQKAQELILSEAHGKNDEKSGIYSELRGKVVKI